ncbi:hypothetical protein PV328_011537 [Microctonus aethiopoides]|uniref:TIL domain-containing protein n=1 Tax=Microctonus aethiopoides TaxID=144406 RepID=A0AA39EUB9_9HYME|nr:hypothetical protein PV328_011537 [Microctonus aethiopoides]
MDYVGVKLLIALAIISTFAGIDAKPQLELGKLPECIGGPHDKLRQCGSSCPSTCSTPEPQICTMQCIINVCQCDEGYVRGPNEQCIHRDQCPK